MSPRAADVAFVLESVEGVTAVYAIDSSQRVSAHFDFAVAMDRGGRVLAEAHYALLRVMTHEECARVFLFHTEAPYVVARGARLLHLSPSEREAARRRVPPPPPREPFPVARPREPFLTTQPGRESEPPSVHVLVVDDHEPTLDVIRSVLGPSSVPVVTSIVDRAVAIAVAHHFDLILCDAKRAFGEHGLLTKLPLDEASRVLVLAARSELVDARWRLQGISRLISRPVKAWILRERVMRAAAGTVNLLWAPDLAIARVAANERPRRTISAPPPSAPFTVLLAGDAADDDAHDALRRIFSAESRCIVRHDPEVAAEVALSSPLHLIMCSASSALHPRSFLDAIAREDPAGADRVIVTAPSRDVSYVRHKLAQQRRKNTVLAFPLDETLLRREVFRHHPELAARIAVADVTSTDATAPVGPLTNPKFRRLAVLVVDDDQTTQILFAAAGPRDDADVALATTAMEAFEHVISRPVDLLLVSATMRGDGGEPFYRVSGACVRTSRRRACS